MGAAGLPGIISIAPQSWGNFIIGLCISMAVSAILTVFLMRKYGGDEIRQENRAQKEDNLVREIAADLKDMKAEAGKLYAPFKGTVKPVAEAADAMFASKAMGDGIVIEPEDGVLVSPVNGEIMMIFPTKHAIGLKADDGEEILIHVGLDTVSLEGKPFEVLVKDGDKVKAGQPLMEVDLEAIRAAGLKTETPMIITNQIPFEITASGEVKAGQEVAKIK